MTMTRADDILYAAAIAFLLAVCTLAEATDFYLVRKGTIEPPACGIPCGKK